MIATQEFQPDPTIWRIESESRPGQHHIVELMNFDGFGECTCENFEFNIGPGLKGGFPENPCKHILAAKVAMADLVLSHMIKNAIDAANAKHG